MGGTRTLVKNTRACALEIAAAAEDPSAFLLLGSRGHLTQALPSGICGSAEAIAFNKSP